MPWSVKQLLLELALLAGRQMQRYHWAVRAIAFEVRLPDQAKHFRFMLEQNPVPNAEVTLKRVIELMPDLKDRSI